MNSAVVCVCACYIIMYSVHYFAYSDGHLNTISVRIHDGGLSYSVISIYFVKI